MLNIHNNESGSLPVHTTPVGTKYIRSTPIKGSKPFGRRTFKRGPKGKRSVGGVASTYLPEKLYKLLVAASKASNKSIADIARAGIVREIGAIVAVTEAGLDLSAFHLTATEVPEQPKPDKKNVVLPREDFEKLLKLVKAVGKIG